MQPSGSSSPPLDCLAPFLSSQSEIPTSSVTVSLLSGGVEMGSSASSSVSSSSPSSSSSLSFSMQVHGSDGIQTECKKAPATELQPQNHSPSAGSTTETALEDTTVAIDQDINQDSNVASDKPSSSIEPERKRKWTKRKGVALSGRSSSKAINERKRKAKELSKHANPLPPPPNSLMGPRKPKEHNESKKPHAKKIKQQLPLGLNEQHIQDGAAIVDRLRQGDLTEKEIQCLLSEMALNCFWMFKYGSKHYTSINSKDFAYYQNKHRVLYITRTEAENAWMDRVLLPLFAKKSRNDKDVLRAKFAMIAIVSRWTERFPDFPKYTNSLEQESSFFSSSFSRSTSNLSLSDLLTNNYYPKPNSSEKPLSLSVRKCLGSISVFALSKIGQFLTQKRFRVGVEESKDLVKNILSLQKKEIPDVLPEYETQRQFNELLVCSVLLKNLDDQEPSDENGDDDSDGDCIEKIHTRIIQMKKSVQRNRVRFEPDSEDVDESETEENKKKQKSKRHEIASSDTDDDIIANSNDSEDGVRIANNSDPLAGYNTKVQRHDTFVDRSDKPTTDNEVGWSDLDSENTNSIPDDTSSTSSSAASSFKPSIGVLEPTSTSRAQPKKYTCRVCHTKGKPAPNSPCINRSCIRFKPRRVLSSVETDGDQEPEMDRKTKQKDNVDRDHVVINMEIESDINVRSNAGDTIAFGSDSGDQLEADRCDSSSSSSSSGKDSNNGNGSGAGSSDEKETHTTNESISLPEIFQGLPTGMKTLFQTSQVIQQAVQEYKNIHLDNERLRVSLKTTESQKDILTTQLYQLTTQLYQAHQELDEAKKEATGLTDKMKKMEQDFHQRLRDIKSSITAALPEV